MEGIVQNMLTNAKSVVKIIYTYMEKNEFQRGTLCIHLKFPTY